MNPEGKGVWGRCHKVAFGRRVARRRARELRASTGEPFRAYACSICGRWHLTTQVDNRVPPEEFNRYIDGRRQEARRLLDALHGRPTRNPTRAELEVLAARKRG